MKKLDIFLTLTIAGSLVFTGCSVDSIIPEKPTEATGTDPTYSLSDVTISSDCDYFNGEYDKLAITDSDHEELKAAVDDWFTSYVENVESTTQSFIEEAIAANEDIDSTDFSDTDTYSDDIDYHLYYEYSDSITVERCDDQIFSFVIENYSYMAGAHGDSAYIGVVFDSQTGQILNMADFGDNTSDFKNYIVSVLNYNSDLKDGLFSEYKDTIDEAFNTVDQDSEDGSYITYWLDNRGMTIAFQEYSIAPYAAGILTFTLPYSYLKNFTEGYLPKDNGFYTTALSYYEYPEYFILANDEYGFFKTIWLENVVDQENYECTTTLHVDDMTYTPDFEGYYNAYAYIIQKDCADYAIIDTIGDSDCHETILLSLTEEGISEITTIEASLDKIEEDKITFSERIDALGTWGGDRYYSYGSDGFTCLDETYYLNNVPNKSSYSVSLKLIQSLDVTFIVDGAEKTGRLQIGDEIYPIEINGDKLTFVMKDGSIGYFNFEYEEGEGCSVNGINEYELFESLPYAS